jgi:pimeloyl-ACP methyl ester carboxylesterase
MLDGEEELVLSTVITHRFLRSGSTVHHFVLAGEASTTPVLLLGGRPDSWWTWHSRIEALAAHHFVIAPALLDQSLRASHVVAVLDDLGVVRLHVVADEGGGALADRLAEAPGTRERVVSYACLGTGPFAHLQDPDLTNRAIIEWLELREQTMGVMDEGRGARTYVLEGA